MSKNNEEIKYVSVAFQTIDSLKTIEEGFFPIVECDEDLTVVKKFNNYFENDDIFEQDLFTDIQRNNTHEVLEFRRKALDWLKKINTWSGEFESTCKTIIERDSDLLKKVKMWIEKDDVITKEQVENNRMHDMSTGIFEPDEAQNRSMFNLLFNRHVSDETRQFQIEHNSWYKMSYLYLYVKLEEILYIGYSFDNVRKNKFLFSCEKITGINETLPYKVLIDDNLKNEFFSVANYYKHQEALPLGYSFKKIEHWIKFVRDIGDQIIKNFPFKKILQNIESAFDDFDGIDNPLGLTGFE